MCERVSFREFFYASFWSSRRIAFPYFENWRGMTRRISAYRADWNLHSRNI